MRALVASNADRKVVLMRLLRPREPLYLVFAAATSLSYLAVTRNFSRVYPRDAAEDLRLRAHVDGFMRLAAPQRWDAASGLLRGRHSWRYREGLAAASTSGDADVRTWARRNPGQHEGDCMVCAVPLDWGNIHAYLERRAAKSWARRRRALLRRVS